MSTGTKADFRDFVVARRARLLRTAFLLTGEHERAEALVGDALARVHGRRRRALRDQDPERYCLAELCRLHLSRWRRVISRTERRAVRRDRPRGRRDTVGNGPGGEDPPEAEKAAGQEQSVAVSDELWAALGRCDARARAVLVLRYYEELPDPEIAELLGSAPQRVYDDAERGLGMLRPALPEDEDEATGDDARERPAGGPYTDGDEGAEVLASDGSGRPAAPGPDATGSDETERAR